MRRTALIILAGAVLTLAVLALVLVSADVGSKHAGGDGRERAGSSPACLPLSLSGSAALAGTAVDVSPKPGSKTANPRTQISFLGAPAGAIHVSSVVGSRSGAHPGHLAAYSQGDGASFLPNRPFDAGETVSVSVSVGSGAAARAVSYSFDVDTPYPTAGAEEFPNPQAAPSDYQSFYTMPGVRAPVLDVTLPDRDPQAGDILTTNGPGPGRYGPLIYTPTGRLVWFDQLSGGETAEDLNEQTYEGRRVLTWWKGHVLSLGFGQGEDLIMSSSYRTIARVPGANGLHADLHDFQIAPRDVAFITAYNPIRCDLQPIKGARDGSILDAVIQEIDIRTGLVRWEWHSLDHVGATESETETPTTTTPWDWFHINSIDPEPDGDILISARNTWAAYQIQGGSGQVLWRLGGLKSSFRMGPGTTTAWQHDGRMLPDGQITIFDDGSNPPVHAQSRALRISIDTTAHTAKLVSSYTHPDPPLLSASQGDMQTLADGNTLVGYGGLPEVSEYAPDGSLLFDAHLPFDLAFYRAFRFPWSGRPATPPAVLASLNNTSEETIVHASWNGATEVSAWRVLAGARPGRLQTRATVAAGTFEVSTTLAQRFNYVSVQALGAHGQVIGSSAATRVISFDASLPGDGKGQ
jgi:hypothetical protein